MTLLVRFRDGDGAAAALRPRRPRHRTPGVRIAIAAGRMASTPEAEEREQTFQGTEHQSLYRVAARSSSRADDTASGFSRGMK
jgi:hypothetical protein